MIYWMFAPEPNSAKPLRVLFDMINSFISVELPQSAVQFLCQYKLYGIARTVFILNDKLIEKLEYIVG